MRTVYGCGVLTVLLLVGWATHTFEGWLDTVVAQTTQPAVKTPPKGPVQTDPLPPEKSLATFTVPDDLEVELVLAEPIVNQPVHISFDERGRLWVMQYLQYPQPAGLKPLSRDQWWRAVYDKVPLPPPLGDKGKDKITIHEDTDGDGQFDKHTTFVDGLNIATACARGRGGVWVLNPPYLLFYPDRNHDDVPDGDPEVHLSGFGLEDSHSVVNSLCFGPDGWLYAAQGSTVSAKVVRPGTKDKPVHTLGQLIWRYHPETKQYEIFAEGGGNAFGVEVDAQGRIFSGHNGGNTRGFHYVQGGYLQKGFSKHGPLSNPYAFGYFPQMPHPNVPRFTHTFTIYDKGPLPEKYHGKLFGVAPLLNHVVISELSATGATFKTNDIGHAIASSDRWFRPVDIKIGPDGAIYVADWYDHNVAHFKAYDGLMDRSFGRIYRIKAKGSKSGTRFDLAKASTADVVKELDSPIKPRRQIALRVLGDRHDTTLIPEVRKRLATAKGQGAVETLWLLHACGGLDEAAALEALDHADPFVRLWTVRLLGDRKNVTAAIGSRLQSLAAVEPNAEARSQLAATAKRLSPGIALGIVRGLASHSEDVADPYIPLQIWWALEGHSDKERQALLELFCDPAFAKEPLVEQHLASRFMRRYASTGARKDLVFCAEILNRSPSPALTKQYLTGFEEAFKGRSLANMPSEMADALSKVGGGSPALKLRRGEPGAVQQALDTIADAKANEAVRVDLALIFGEVHEPRSVAVLTSLLTQKSDPLQRAAMTALLRYDSPDIGKAVLARYASYSSETRDVAQMLLASRKGWANDFVQAVLDGEIRKELVSDDTARKMTVHRDDMLALKIRQVWGSLAGATTDEMKAEIERLANLLREGEASPYEGKKLFAIGCGKCHVLFAQGGQIGPDLTSFKRDDLSTLLVNVVNPSAEIREGFESQLVFTKDGRSATGFLVDQDPQVVILRGTDGQNVVIARDAIDEIIVQRKSLMPEGLLKPLTDQQIRDLFAYLRSAQPLP